MGNDHQQCHYCSLLCEVAGLGTITGTMVSVLVGGEGITGQKEPGLWMTSKTQIISLLRAIFIQIRKGPFYVCVNLWISLLATQTGLGTNIVTQTGPGTNIVSLSKLFYVTVF